MSWGTSSFPIHQNKLITCQRYFKFQSHRKFTKMQDLHVKNSKQNFCGEGTPLPHVDAHLQRKDLAPYCLPEMTPWSAVNRKVQQQPNQNFDVSFKLASLSSNIEIL